MQKIILFLILIIFVWQTPRILSQTAPESFFVKNVYINLDADTRYVRKLANKTISWDKKINNGEIECFKNELLKSGLFENFQTRLAKLDEEDEYNLTVTVNYQSQNPVFKISNIKLEGFNDIDEIKFNSALSKNRITEKILSLKTDFPVFENQIIQAIQDSYVGKASKDKLISPWIEIRLNMIGELDILVLPSFKGCSESQK